MLRCEVLASSDLPAIKIEDGFGLATSLYMNAFAEYDYRKIQQTDHWLYTGKEDPICVVDLSFDVWWVEPNNVGKKCMEELVKRDCFFIKTVELSLKVGFLENTHHMQCVGVKYNLLRIEQHPEWKRVYRMIDDVNTVFGKPYFVRNDTKWSFISYMYKDLSLYVSTPGKYMQIFNLEFDKDGRRLWADYNMIRMKSYDDKTDQLFALGVTGNREIEYKQGFRMSAHCRAIEDCDSVWMKTTSTYDDGYNEYVPTETGQQYVMYKNSDNDIGCVCLNVSRHTILEKGLVNIEIEDKTDTWVNRIMTLLKTILAAIIKTVTSAITQAFSWIANAIFGEQWQGKMAYTLVMYYIVSQFTNSTVAGLAFGAYKVYMFIYQGS